MNLIRIIDGSPVPYSILELRKSMPNKSIPVNPTAEYLASYDVFQVFPTDKPVADVVTALDPVFNVPLNRWEEAWSGRAYTQEELDAQLAAERAGMRVSRLNCRVYLIQIGLWDNIQPLINAIPDPMQKALAQAFFEDAQNWERMDATVIMLAQGLGLSEEQLDTMFREAATIL